MNLILLNFYIYISEILKCIDVRLRIRNQFIVVVCDYNSRGAVKKEIILYFF